MSSKACEPAHAGKVGRSCAHAPCKRSGCRRSSPLPHLSGLPCQYQRRVVGAKFTTSAALAHPTGRRQASPSPASLRVSPCQYQRRVVGTMFTTTAAPWVQGHYSIARGVCKPPSPLWKNAQNFIIHSGNARQIPVLWKVRLTFSPFRAILHPWKANFPRKEAAR